MFQDKKGLASVNAMLSDLLYQSSAEYTIHSLFHKPFQQNFRAELQDKVIHVQSSLFLTVTVMSTIQQDFHSLKCIIID